MNKELIKKELNELVAEGNTLIKILEGDKEKLSFRTKYQQWYTKSLKVVKFLASDRYNEFKAYYEIDTKRKQFGYGTYVIQDFIKNVVPASIPKFDSVKQTSLNLFNQISIIESLLTRIDSIIANIDIEMLSDIHDSELDTAKELIKVNVRAAGSLAGVIIENHLQNVIKRREISCSKKNPTISDLNELLKKFEVYEITTWRKITYLGDIRNICSHKKDQDPTKEQVIELIEGANWILKNVF